MKKLLVLACATMMASGCASVMTAESQSINVTTSNNKPAEVTIDDKTVTAPGMVVVLRDGKDKVVKTKTAGCDNATVVEKSVTPVFFGNIVIGGLLGSTTDGVTGKMWDYADSVEISCAE
ncbi:adenosine deaminase [Brumicola blandensis]|uniref:Adenosine deaminase n=1 Tax=Brumicola blandensis TaxID=3075611 RepID=A0AAW8R3K0_9ALTE|nr:adenosine deaminase [Alteromonas sp. W409]MDT0583998.1 adenosine deaminase [Alteromonas sp. W409]